MSKIILPAGTRFTSMSVLTTIQYRNQITWLAIPSETTVQCEEDLRNPSYPLLGLVPVRIKSIKAWVTEGGKGEREGSRKEKNVDSFNAGYTFPKGSSILIERSA